MTTAVNRAVHAELRGVFLQLLPYDQIGSYLQLQPGLQGISQRLLVLQSAEAEPQAAVF